MRREFLFGLGLLVAALGLIGATTISGPLAFTSTFSTTGGTVDVAAGGITGAMLASGAISGDCAAAAGGVVTCSKTGGTAFAASATTDATNAANITSGTLAKARGGTAGSTGQAAAANLSLAYVLCQSAVASSHTGDTAETTLATCAIPANAMGPNGRLRIFAQFSFTNNADAKTARIEFNPGGTQYLSIAGAGAASGQYVIDIADRNATNSQVGGVALVGAIGSTAPVTSAVDTTGATSLSFTGQLGTSSDTITLESYSVELLPSAGN
ncbi:MAG TPA: hypothetical protein VND95_03330 [Stellaceae bacterium]|nr:hypothetical protein [Stellaceae bacterium]